MKCKMCEQHVATTHSSVDFRTDLSIPVCRECASVLSQWMRIDYSGHRNAAFMKEHGGNLKRACDALYAQIEEQAQ